MEQHPTFLELQSGNLFAVRFRGRSTPKFRILFIPPFAEELNKCRRLMVLAARQLASAGCDVLIPDLYGTGDSDGEFGDTTWDRWVRNLVDAEAWFAEHSEALRFGCLAIRSGMLLANDTLKEIPRLHTECLVAWQPVFNGRQFLSQFLRLRVVSARLAGINESQAAFENSLVAGESIEVAGYELSPEVAQALLSTEIDHDGFSNIDQVCILESKSAGAPTVTRATENFVSALKERGKEAKTSVLGCEPFWKTQEVTAPNIVVSETVNAFAARFGTDR